MQDYFLELSSEIIPMLMVVILMINIKEKRRELKTSLIALSIIEIPAFLATVYCIVTGIPRSGRRHVIITAVFAFAALIYVAYSRKKHGE